MVGADQDWVAVLLEATGFAGPVLELGTGYGGRRVAPASKPRGSGIWVRTSRRALALTSQRISNVPRVWPHCAAPGHLERF